MAASGEPCIKLAYEHEPGPINTIVDISVAVEDVQARIKSTCDSFERPLPRLVAVSKTKPPDMILSAYNSGLRHFGENYVIELIEKANHPLLKDLDISWHYIGHLQRNKCNNITSIPNLWMIETVDSAKLATALNSSWGREERTHRLDILIQVNTSNEESKSGCNHGDVIALYKHIKEACPALLFRGLMTIGRAGHDYSLGPNPDFKLMSQLRNEVASRGDLLEEEVELSMGMSADFTEAIAAGSTNVRIGSTIFGARE